MTTQRPPSPPMRPGASSVTGLLPVDGLADASAESEREPPLASPHLAASAAVRHRRPSLQRVLRRTHLRLAVSAVVLAAVSLSLVAWIALRVYAENNLLLIGRSLAYTTEAAVVFGDRVAAQEAIALIASDEDLAQVRVLDAGGAQFALWRRPDGGALTQVERAVASFALPGPVTLPIRHDGRLVGSIEVQGQGHQFFLFLLTGVGGVLACLLVTFAVANVLAKRMHHDIVKPLRALAEVAHAVRRERAFHQRVAATPLAELKELGDDFNALLDEFEGWQNHLRAQNATLAHQANHDRLTGLPNRAYFESRLAKALADAREMGTHVALLYLDSDRFKEINDHLGHGAGDAVLVSIAERLRQPLREGDLVARLGGDEFAVMLVGVRQTSNAVRLAQTLLAAMEKPIALPDGAEIVTSMSIGVALYPIHAADAVALLRTADAAMYQAKRAGVGTWHVADIPTGAAAARRSS
ncbi:diguanylate cyclase domain-containing protein [Pandoraea terrigena]|uniref:Putative diguanylate cyclase YfiN n=1 Tax=Pandoraea terrigena TaxID=2508292 RepID=A0A5E4TDK5_9BURK|nr:diguanylate cyclase [Pandoraea terrigena]VVD84608.1 putative diguanylate cyclase YfiN [Pandoraea terrigena]